MVVWGHWGKRENSGGEELMKRTVGQNQKLQKGEKADKNIKKVNFQIENPTLRHQLLATFYHY